MTPDAELQIFAIKRGQLEQRIDVSFYLPSMTGVLTKIKNSKYEVVHLNKLLDDLTDGTHYTPSYTEKGVKFISVTNITENKIDFENTKYISEKEHSEFIRRCNPESNSILLTKIGSIGRAAVIPESCPPFSIFVSVALLKVNKKIIPDFLCAYLNSSLALRQFERYLKGIGVPDLHLENIAQTQIIVPDRDEQKKFARDYMNAFANYQNKLLAAEELLAGMDEFVLDILGIKPCSEAKKICFAIKRKALDGVIDVKRHLGGMQLGNFKVQDIANIADQKINPQNFPDDIFDWIRIDDLPNHPLGITEIRTESGKNIEGTFFEVFPGDILVARLGPTILNRKTVMVRTTQRRTIASAEFLVLRCKEGFSPESVMAVIKTKFFVEQMYAHARGSTPSRYRLNREDMLSLPFPDISAVQEQIKTESIYRKKTAAKLRQEAEKEWQDAREQFEKELLGE